MLILRLFARLNFVFHCRTPYPKRIKSNPAGPDAFSVRRSEAGTSFSKPSSTIIRGAERARSRSTLNTSPALASLKWQAERELLQAAEPSDYGVAGVMVWLCLQQLLELKGFML